MINRHDVKIFLQVLRRYSQKDPLLLPITIACNILGVISPFLSVILISMLLDGITAGKSMENLIKTAVFGSAIIFFFTQIYNYLMKKRCERWLRTWPMQTEWLVEKNLLMDYELLEDSEAQFLIRKQKDYRSMHGGICYQLFAHVESLIKATATLITSLILAVPMFFTSGIIGILVPAALLLLIAPIQKKKANDVTNVSKN